MSAGLTGGALLLISLVGSLWWIGFGLLGMGIATGLYLPSGVATLTKLVMKRDWGKAFAVHELAPNISLVCAPIVVEAIVRWSTWRTVPALLGITALLLWISYGKFGRGGDFSGEVLNLSLMKTLLAIPSFWIMMFFFGLGIGASLGVYTMIPLYLIAEKGFERTEVNVLVAASRIPGMGLAFLAGWLSDRFSPKTTLFGVFLITGITTLMLGTVGHTWLVPAVFLQPMVAVCFFPAGFSALSQVGAESWRNVTVSLTVPVGFFIGGGLIPAGIGFAGTHWSFSRGICTFGGILIVSAFLAPFLRLRDRDSDGHS